MEHRSVLRAIDLFAFKHLVDLLLELCGLCQLEELVDGLGGGLLPRVVEEDALELRCHCLASVGVGHEVAQVRLVDGADVRLRAVG